ncbi:transcriptional regulator Zur, partial [Salmonella enterica subsp. enterica serovar Enteritidis]|nr:transcriptional regulator Zur [Salmonella enterica subsp. enterica serovar Enteritidis]
GPCPVCVEVEACRHPGACCHDHPALVKKKPR